MSAIFELVFEGPSDSTPETLRRVKSALVVDLSLTVEDARHILEATPSTIISSSDKNDLNAYYSILKNAGAKVLIVKKGDDIDVDDDTPFTDKADVWNEAQADTNIVEDAPTEPIEFEFELGNDEILENKNDDTPKITKVYQLPDEESFDELNQSSLDTHNETNDFENFKSRVNQNTSEDCSPLNEAEALTSSDSEPLFPFLEELPTTDEDTISTATEPQATEALPSFQFEALSNALKLTEEEIEETPPKKNEVTAKIQEDLLADDSSASYEMQDEEPQVSEDSSHNRQDSNVDPLSDLSLASAEPVTTTQPSRQSFSKTDKKNVEPISEDNSQAVPLGQQRQSYTQQEIGSKDTENSIQQNTHESRKSKMSNILEILVPAVLLSAILVIGNIYYFSLKSTLPVQKPKLVEVPFKDKEIRETKPDNVEATHYKVPFAEHIGDQNIQGEFEIKDNSLIGLKIEITTKEPPKRTPEQIVRRELRDPWLQKVVIDSLPFEWKENGKFVASGTGRAFIEDNGQRMRAIPFIALDGNYDQASKKVKVNYQVKYNVDNAKDQSSSIIRLEKNNYAFRLEGILIAGKQ